MRECIKHNVKVYKPSLAFVLCNIRYKLIKRENHLCDLFRFCIPASIYTPLIRRYARRQRREAIQVTVPNSRRHLKINRASLIVSWLSSDARSPKGDSHERARASGELYIYV